MDPNNNGNLGDSPITPVTPAAPENPVMPQPLNTSVGTPTEMPMGEPAPATPPPPGLPPEFGANPQVNKTPGKSGKIMMMGIIAVILIILGVGGYYFYTTMGANKGVDNTQTIQELNGLQKETQGVEVADPEGQLKTVDDEINQLEATPSLR